MRPAAAATSARATSSTMPTEPERGALWLLSKACRACPSLRSGVGFSARSWPAMTLECLKPAYRRKSQLRLFPSQFALWVTRPLVRAQPIPAQLHDVADHFGDRLVVFGRDGLVDLNGGMERAGERRVFHDRHRVLGADF